MLELSALQLSQALERQCLARDAKQLDTRGVAKSNSVFIPIDTLLRTICNEWSEILRAEKNSFGAVGEANESLKKLNEIYDKDCALTKVVVN